MANIEASDVIRVVVGVLISVVMIGVLVPILDNMIGTTESPGPLNEFGDLLMIVPMILVVVIVIMAVGPIIKKKF